MPKRPDEFWKTNKKLWPLGFSTGSIVPVLKRAKEEEEQMFGAKK